MTERFCKKCNKMCHCTNAESDQCEKCDCKEPEGVVKEPEGVVIDDTNECESCQ